MSRSLRKVLLLCAAAGFLAAGCGARTGDDELLGDGPIGIGGSDISGGTHSGGAGVGGSGTGAVATGGVGAGGVFPTGGVGTGGGIWTGGFGGIPTGGAGGIPNFNPCCEASDTAGCQDPFITQCVCSKDPFCCDSSWDGLCAEEVEDLGCGTCNVGTGGVSTGGTAGTGGIIWTGGFGGVPAGGTAGTGGIIWTGGFGGMPTGGTAGTGGTGGNPGNCCAAHNSAGCHDDSIESCVCKSDSYCCTNRWDNLCVSEVETLGCGSCNMGTGGAGTGGNGTGGVGQCEVVFPDECGSCLCNGCYDQLIQCATDFGCIAIQQCFEATSCVGVNCYKPQTCKTVIDAFGGWNGPSMNNALQFAACVGLSGCPCQ